MGEEKYLWILELVEQLSPNDRRRFRKELDKRIGEGMMARYLAQEARRNRS